MHRHKKGTLIGQVNKLLAKFSGANVQVKRKLFQSYCTALYGSQTWDLCSDNIDTIAKTWNRGIRKVLGIPQNTHCILTHLLIGMLPLPAIIAVRMCKYITQWCTSENELVRYLAQRSIHSFHGNIGSSIKHIMTIYNIDRSLLTKPSRCKDIITQHHMASDNDKRLAQQIWELISHGLIGFTREEVNIIVRELCTT